LLQFEGKTRSQYRSQLNPARPMYSHLHLLYFLYLADFCAYAEPPSTLLPTNFDKLSATERERMYALPNRGVQGSAAPLRNLPLSGGVNYVLARRSFKK
jgi:hypothetical protein